MDAGASPAGKPQRTRDRFNSAPIFYDSEFDPSTPGLHTGAAPSPRRGGTPSVATSAVSSSSGGRGGALMRTRTSSRSRSGSIVMSGFFCPLCKEQMSNKSELLAHCCGQSKQSLESVRNALSRARSVRLTPDTLERWAKYGTPQRSPELPGDTGGAASLRSRPPNATRGGGRRMTVGGGGELKVRDSHSASPTAYRNHGQAAIASSVGGSGGGGGGGGAAARAGGLGTIAEPARTGFICPHCKVALPGKRELLLHRCGLEGGGGGRPEEGAGEGGEDARDSPKTAQEKKKEERRKRFEYWQQQCFQRTEGQLTLDAFMVNCGPKVGVKPQWQCEHKDGRSHIRVGPGNNTKSGRRLKTGEVLLELKHVLVEGRCWVAFYDHKSARVMWTPTTSLSGKTRLRRYDPVRREVLPDSDDELPEASAAAVQRAVYHARMEKHAREGRLKPGLSTDVSESMEFIRRLHEFRKAYPSSRVAGGGGGSAPRTLSSTSAAAAATASPMHVPGRSSYDL